MLSNVNINLTTKYHYSVLANLANFGGIHSQALCMCKYSTTSVLRTGVPVPSPQENPFMLACCCFSTEFISFILPNKPIDHQPDVVLVVKACLNNVRHHISEWYICLIIKNFRVLQIIWIWRNETGNQRRNGWASRKSLRSLCTKNLHE